ncbi:MAG: TetR/AcrR family transcriptional regulator [Eubacterium sp.]|jgi:AcrR family transcriptional regulator|nr:TetR/AcrR family transcriptional regulator [Eubacterium sp.]
MKTILQIAKEIGVSKQAVYKRYKGKLYTEVCPYVHTERGTTYILEQGEEIIKADFLSGENGESVSVGAHTERIQDIHTEHIQDTHTDTLIQMLKNELELKNKQIEELTATIRIQAESINADRRNALAETMENIIDSGKLIEEEKPKRGFFSWLKKK